MKNKLFFALFGFGLIACQTQNNDPAVVASNFVQAINSGQFEKALPYVTNASQNFINNLNKAGKTAEGMNMEVKDFHLTKPVFGQPNIAGNNATVHVSATEFQNGIDLPLKKENGEWKVEFTLESMLKIAFSNLSKQKMDINGAAADSLESKIMDAVDDASKEMEAALKDSAN
jgi:hypothetical protein